MAIIEEIVREIDSHHHFLITTHIHPDGDAVGSLLAMGFLLTYLGKKAVLFTQDPIPLEYLFLPGVEKITHELPDLSGMDGCLVLDCGDDKRMGRSASQLLNMSPIIVIDHHLGHTPFGDVCWVDPKRSAVGEMIYHLIKSTGTDISYNMALNLYVAILTDTGGFRYASTSSQVMRIAAEMIDLGVKPNWVSERIYENRPVNSLRLLSAALSTLRTYYEGRVGLINVSRNMLRATCTSVEDTGDFVNYPRSIAGIHVAIIIKEMEDGLFNISLRSRNGVNVARLAEKFGGGGHFNAAGFKRRGDYENVKHELLEEIGLLLEKKVADANEPVRNNSDG